MRTGEEETVEVPSVVTVSVPVNMNITTVQEKHSLLAVYISLPIVVLVVITAVALIFYYKK